MHNLILHTSFVPLSLYIGLLILFLCNNIIGNEIEIDSAVILCENLQNFDQQVINWHPTPLPFLGINGSKIGPHEPNSALAEQIQNNVELKYNKKCKRKLLVTLKLKNDGKVSSEGSLVKIDHVMNEMAHKYARLGLPIGIKIQQIPMSQIYKLKHLYTVNAKPYEKVMNFENTKNYEGCNDSDRPTCGIQRDELNNAIPDSQGFCCLCEGDTQIRGGQSCSSESPLGHPSAAYHASAHCFTYSKYWYAVYEISEPELFHKLYLQVYKSGEFDNGTIYWTKITNSKDMIRIDRSSPEYKGQNVTISYRKPNSYQLPTQSRYLVNASNFKLLVPIKHHEIKTFSNESESNETDVKIPEPFDGPPEDTFLVVPNSLFSPDGDDCNRIGVSFTAFNKKQLNPCTLEKGSCLENQPFDLWTRDSDELSYRLKNFGPINNDSPFLKIGDELFLDFNHEQSDVTYVDIEMDADDLQMATPEYNAQIENVLTDNTVNSAKVVVQIVNNELASASFAVHLVKCTGDYISNQETEYKSISPQKMKSVSLVVKDLRPIYEPVWCAVALLNSYKEIIAIRRVLFSPLDVCLCYLHCRCSCSKNQFKCIRMKSENIRAAGIGLGPLGNKLDESYLKLIMDTSDNDTDKSGDYVTPQASKLSQTENETNSKSKSAALIEMFILILLIILILLLLGLLKGLLGLCCPPVAACGLCYYYDQPQKIPKYYEKHYIHIPVLYDENGHPVDPFTKKPTVQRFTKREVFIWNVFFVLLSPFHLIYWLVKTCSKCAEQQQKTASSSDNNFDKNSRKTQSSKNSSTNNKPSTSNTNTNTISQKDSDRTGVKSTYHAPTSKTTSNVTGTSKKTTDEYCEDEDLKSKKWTLDMAQKQDQKDGHQHKNKDLISLDESGQSDDDDQQNSRVVSRKSSKLSGIGGKDGIYGNRSGSGSWNNSTTVFQDNNQASDYDRPKESVEKNRSAKVLWSKSKDRSESKSK